MTMSDISDLHISIVLLALPFSMISTVFGRGAILQGSHTHWLNSLPLLFKSVLQSIQKNTYVAIVFIYAHR